jgi:hypothetical protein
VTHLPYIVAAYGLTALIGGFFAVSAWLRMGAAARRLAAIDPRGRR